MWIEHLTNHLSKRLNTTVWLSVGAGQWAFSLWTELNMSFSDKLQQWSASGSNRGQNRHQIILIIVLFHYVGLTQTFKGVVVADICHGNNINRITSCLAICLPIKSTMFILLLQCFISSLIRDFILKSCELASEDCVDCLTKFWNSRHAVYQKIKAVK